MSITYDALVSREETLKKLINSKTDSLKSIPEGRLEIHAEKEDTRYYQVTKEGKKAKRKRKYIHKEDIQLARDLAQVYYDKRVLSLAKDELKPLKQLIGIYEKGTCEKIYEKMNPARQQLVIPAFVTDEEFVRQWLAKPYKKPGFAENDPELYADDGLRVRSKSEILIANKYDQKKIPKKYEEPLYLKGYGWVNPDFRVLNIRLRKEFIHEHLGKMDDPEYAVKNIAKLNAYMRNGYFPGKNLIITFETQSAPFDARIMDDIIEQYLR